MHGLTPRPLTLLWLRRTCSFRACSLCCRDSCGRPRVPSHRRACRHMCCCAWTGRSHSAWSPLVEVSLWSRGSRSMFARRASATYERCSVACIMCAMDVASSNLEVADGAPAMRMPTAFATVRPEARAIRAAPMPTCLVRLVAVQVTPSDFIPRTRS